MVTFTDPEVARVGLNEKESGAHCIPYEISTYDIANLDPGKKPIRPLPCCDFCRLIIGGIGEACFNSFSKDSRIPWLDLKI
jgi:hypothetical protein